MQLGEGKSFVTSKMAVSTLVRFSRSQQKILVESYLETMTCWHFLPSTQFYLSLTQLAEHLAGSWPCQGSFGLRRTGCLRQVLSGSWVLAYQAVEPPKNRVKPGFSPDALSASELTAPACPGLCRCPAPQGSSLELSPHGSSEHQTLTFPPMHLSAESTAHGDRLSRVPLHCVCPLICS